MPCKRVPPLAKWGWYKSMSAPSPVTDCTRHRCCLPTTTLPTAPGSPRSSSRPRARATNASGSCGGTCRSTGSVGSASPGSRAPARSVTDEIKFGDNDTLGALVANLVDADCLIILTDQQGLFTADPRKDPAATLISEAVAGEPRLEAMAGGAGSSIGKGGMITKVLAAKRAARSGAHTAIANGNEPDVMPRLADGESIGTLLVAQTQPLAARKQWLADHLQLTGKLVLDEGAIKALRGGRSLLPVGVRKVIGEFERGAAVACVSPEGAEIARGLVNYPANETRRIAGKPSNNIESILGYIDEPELIHRDNLILLS